MLSPSRRYLSARWAAVTWGGVMGRFRLLSFPLHLFFFFSVILKIGTLVFQDDLSHGPSPLGWQFNLVSLSGRFSRTSWLPPSSTFSEVLVRVRGVRHFVLLRKHGLTM